MDRRGFEERRGEASRNTVFSGNSSSCCKSGFSPPTNFLILNGAASVPAPSLQSRTRGEASGRPAVGRHCGGGSVLPLRRERRRGAQRLSPTAAPQWPRPERLACFSRPHSPQTGIAGTCTLVAMESLSTCASRGRHVTSLGLGVFAQISASFQREGSGKPREKPAVPRAQLRIPAWARVRVSCTRVRRALFLRSRS